MRRILEEELEEERLVGVIFPKTNASSPNVLLILGECGNPSMETQTDLFGYVGVTTRTGRDTSSEERDEEHMSPTPVTVPLSSPSSECSPSSSAAL